MENDGSSIGIRITRLFTSDVNLTYLRCKGGEAGDPSNGETEEQVAASDGNLRASTRETNRLLPIIGATVLSRIISFHT